jgi:hypothetical protein
MVASGCGAPAGSRVDRLPDSVMAAVAAPAANSRKRVSRMDLPLIRTLAPSRGGFVARPAPSRQQRAGGAGLRGGPSGTGEAARQIGGRFRDRRGGREEEARQPIGLAGE